MDLLAFEKILYHPERLERIKRNERQFPVHLTLSLGNYCNHRCLWCTAYEYQQAKANQIDFDQILAFIRLAAERGTRAIGYVGNGEPTAYARFGELTDAISALGLDQGIFTNGYLADRYADQLLSNFTYVRISLDAGSAETHAVMHDVDGQFDKIIENTKFLAANRSAGKPTIGIQFATHHENIKDLMASARLAKQIGADYFSVKPVFNRGSVGERIEKNTLTYDQLSPAVAKIRQELESPNFQIFYRPHQIISESVDHNILQYDRCVAGFFNLNVYEDGALVYCGPHRVSVGNMGDDIDVIEERILVLSRNLDLSKCPAGCRYHSLNHLVDTVINPERAAPYHVNFL